MTRDGFSKIGKQSGRRAIGVEEFGDTETEEAIQRVGPLVEIPGLLRELGSDPAEVFDSARLDAGIFETSENRAPWASMERLLRECLETTGCDHFALLLGQRTRLSHLGLPGEMIRHSPTLGTALRTFAVYQHLNTHGMAKVLLEKDGVAILGNVVFQKGSKHADQVYDLEIAATVSVIREICGPHWSPERVLFSHAKPTNVAPYRRFFRAPCKFDSERTALVFPAAVLERKLAGADSSRLRVLETQAQARSDFGLVFRLRRTLRTMLVAEAASGDEVAKLLSMHRRTLNRRLKAEGTTFQKVLDEVRYEAACQLLDSARIPITEIAASLGYSETSAFSRAFRRWSGATPVQRREGFQTHQSGSYKERDAS